MHSFIELRRLELVRKLVNESGNSLLTVFLIITIFSILFLSFLGQSFSGVKQNQVVEKKSQSVALAEMGINYFQVALKDIYLANQDSVNTAVLEQIDIDNPEKSNDEYTNLAINKMSDAIKNGIKQEFGKDYNSYPLLKKDIASDASFSIKNLHIEEDTVTNEIRISFVSVGTEIEKSSPLKMEMTIKVTPKAENPGGIKIDLDAVVFNNIQRPGLLDSLIDSLLNLNSNLFNKTLYALGKLTLNGSASANTLTNVKLHSGNDLTIGDEVIYAENLFIETNGKLNINGPFTVGNTAGESSNILVNGNLDTDAGDLTLNNNTFAFIGGNLNLGSALILKDQSFAYVDGNLVGKNSDDKKVTVGSGCKLCVKGNLSTSPLNVEVGAKLIVSGQITKGFTGDPTGVASNISGEKFKKLCEADLPYEWVNTLENDIDYNYQN